MTLEQRLCRRLNRELGGWPSAASEEFRTIVRQELEHACEAGEIPLLGATPYSYPVVLYFYGGHLQVVFLGSTYPVIPPRKEQSVQEQHLPRLRCQMCCVFAAVCLFLLTTAVVQVLTRGGLKSIVLLALMGLGYGLSAFHFWKTSKEDRT